MDGDSKLSKKIETEEQLDERHLLCQFQYNKSFQYHKMIYKKRLFGQHLHRLVCLLAG